MLLTTIRHALRRPLGRVRSEQDGVAMPAVIGAMALTMIVAGAIVPSAVSSANVSTITRADVQSTAAADAGIDTAFARLRVGDYPCSFTAPAPLAYTVTISYRSSSGPIGCGAGGPASTPASARVVSVGTASSPALVDASAGNAATVVADFTLTQTPTSTTSSSTTASEITAGGPAIYSYGSATFGGSGTLASVNGSRPRIMIRTGNVQCSGGAQNGVDDFLVPSGSLTLSGSCAITGTGGAGGNVWVRDRLSISGGASVGGFAVAKGITLDGSGTITGSAWSETDITAPGGTVGGNTTAASLTLGSNGKVRGNAWTYGHTSATWGGGIAGNLTTKSYSAPQYSSLVSGTTTVKPGGTGPSPYTYGATPTVPPWVDYAYAPEDWGGFTVKTLSGGSCGYAQLSAALTELGATRGVIDARGCASGLNLGGAEKVTLRADLAIIANKMSFTGSSGFLANTAARLWLVNPDTTADRIATCGGRSLSMDGGFTQSDRIAMLVYSPCRVTLASGLKLYGQVFAGQVELAGAVRIAYTPIGLPGWNLGTGEPVPTSTTVTVVTPGPPTYAAVPVTRFDVQG